MLILTREAVPGIDVVRITTPDGYVIDVTVSAIRVSGDNGGRRKVRLGFEAPKEVSIVRGELVRQEVVA